MWIGAVVGLIAGALAYTLSSAPIDRYAHDGRSDAALQVGFTALFVAAAVADVVDRMISATRRGHGADSILGARSGGHIWYVPMWIFGIVVAALFASH